VNSLLGGYRLESEIARGGMGIVWRARGKDGLAVVVKELRPELAADPQYVAMFLEETRLAVMLRHPNIVETTAVGCGEPSSPGDRGRWFMVMELLSGATLRSALSVLGDELGLAARVAIVRDVLVALHHAHDLRDGQGNLLGVVHRDVTPNNVFLGFDGRVKLLDFGVAKHRGRALETRAGVLKGSVAYMAPDHVCGASIDRRADVFAAGVLLREMITGKRVWGDLEELAIVRRLALGDVPAFPEDVAVPRALRIVCERAMQARRADRYPSADAMREALDEFLATLPAASLGDAGARLAGATAGALTELSASVLVTDAPRARGGMLAAIAGVAAALTLGMAGTLVLVRDALVVEDEAPLAIHAQIAAPAPPPVVAPPPPAPSELEAPVRPEEPAAVAEEPELPPNPYDDEAAAP
jgi:serine/threonine-protein kinase